MTKQNEIKIFEEKKVRTLWDSEQEKWYMSIIDVIAILTESPNPRKYWSVLKTRLKAEGSQLATNCSQLKMKSADSKFYLTDVTDTEQLFRLIQSIPSQCFILLPRALGWLQKSRFTKSTFSLPTCMFVLQAATFANL